METKVIHLEENGLNYQLYCSTNADNFYGRQKNLKIKLFFGDKQFEIGVEYGTLQRDFVSADGKYLILIFNQNHSKYFPPCNVVVYNVKGELIHRLCPPELTNKDILGKYDVYPNIMRRFTGGGFHKDKKCFVIGVSYDDIRRPSGSSSYLETRLFDPEKGEIGDVLHWDLPWR